MSFRDLSKLLAIALESLERNHQHLETNVVHFSYEIVNIYLFAQSCKENKLTPLCFLVNSRSHILAKQHHIIMSRDIRYPTMWYVRQAKPQISLRIRTV